MGLFKHGGNITATLGVFFDSFSKITVSVAVMAGLLGLKSQIIYEQIMPGTCFALFILNFFYYTQALALSKRTGLAATAIPSGLQASCVFVWLFAIMLPIVLKTKDPLLAYHVALVANLINALVYTIVGIALYRFKNLIPKPALFGALAGSAFTWLSVNNVEVIFNHPISGVIPLFLMLLLFFGKIKTKLSPLLIGITLGVILAYVTHDEAAQAATGEMFNIFLPKFYVNGVYTALVFNNVWAYLPLIVSFALIDAISAVQILEEVALSGDKPSPYWSILVSGFISGASSLLGNPFAMALFYGHATWKKVRATALYSLWVGILFLFLGCLGFSTLIIHYIPDWVSLNVLIFIGISTTTICFAKLDHEYYSILVIAMIPILMEMIYNKIEFFALKAHLADLNTLSGGVGLLTIAKGSIMFSITFASLLYYVTKRQWLLAFATSLVMLCLSVFGFMHALIPGFYLYQPMNIVYLCLSGFCLLNYSLQRTIF